MLNLLYELVKGNDIQGDCQRKIIFKYKIGQINKLIQFYKRI